MIYNYKMPNAKEETLKLDCEKECLFSFNTFFNKKLCKSDRYVATNVFAPSGKEVVSGAKINGDIYLYCNDGYIYKKTSSGFSKFFNASFSGEVKMLALPKNGSLSIVAVSETGAVMKSGSSETQVTLPFGEYLVSRGTLFVASGSDILISKRFDYTNFTVNYGAGSLIKIPSSSGTTLGLSEIEGKIYIFCKYAVYELTVNGEYDFTLKKLPLDFYEICENSVSEVGGKTYLFCDGKFCAFNGKELKEIPLFKEKLNFTSLSAYSFGGNFVMPLSVNGYDGNYVFVFDTKTGNRYLTEQKGLAIIGSEYAVNTLTNEFYVLGKDSSNGNYYLKTDKIYLDKNVYLSGLKVFSMGSATVKLTGDFGAKSVSVVKGLNEKPLNLKTNYVVVEIISTDGDFGMGEITLSYTKA